MTTAADRSRPAIRTEPAPQTLLQRKCGCEGGGAAGALTGQCDDCQQKKLQRRAAPSSSGSSEFLGGSPAGAPEEPRGTRGTRGTVDDVLSTSGTPLDPGARREMEPRFGHDLSNVRIHTDAPAAESARSVGALAYTVGSHVVFGANQYAPSTQPGRHLLAHELTHTIQQRGVIALQRQEMAVSSPADAAEVEADRVADQVTGLLVDDEVATASAGQMRKTEFLDELQRSSCAAADAELARVGRSTEGCPLIERAFSRYRTMPAARVEQAIRRYVDPAGVTSARDYIPLVSRRVSEGVARWATTGDMSGVPPELAAEAGGGGGLLGMIGGGMAGLVGGIGRLLFKRDGGAGATPGEAAMVSTSLGRGAPLESGVRGRMESAFGYDFSSVRIHSGDPASSVSSSLGARAFTLGNDIGFSAGEYRPNTLAGDALIAHELAHVVQQSSGGASSAAVEEDADHSAVGAMMSAWSGAKSVARSAMPRLRSGLGLQRCSSTPAATRPAAVPTAACTTIDRGRWQELVTAAIALPDVATRGSTMASLVQQAVCSLGITITEAGTAHTTLVREDYAPQPVVNFDVNLHSKRAVEDNRLLNRNAGYSFRRGSETVSVLGPKALEPRRLEETQMFAQHELYVGSSTNIARDDATVELESWTRNFTGYFHRYFDLPLPDRPRWQRLVEYYDGAAADAQSAAIQQLVSYYNTPPTGTDAERVRRELRSWMRRMTSRNNGGTLVPALTAALPAP